ncbi:unnamed protein product [Rhizoctonia solani]|uniref:Uncharacterized protein n=1 Tax=Rhizoctonia solani TaxID=456999 RepID=A0A8H3GYR6_9AGAM|nr:unnamed protein product [Rhizoctonia solani]
MSKRLASFGGPSTPTSSPVTGQSASTPTKTGGKKKPTPTSPNPRSPRTNASRKPNLKPREETDIQRLVRTTLKLASLELVEWEQSTRNGLQDAKLMVDRATELDNALGSIPSSDTQPRFRVVTDKLDDIEVLREATRSRIIVIRHHFSKIVKRANKLEQALIEFVQTNGVDAAEQTPLWAGKTWSLGQYVLHMHRILRPLNRLLHTIQVLTEKVIAYGLSGGLSSEETLLLERQPLVPGQGAVVPTFEETRSVMALWAAEAKVVEETIREWNEMCNLEIVGWDKKLEQEARSSDEDEDETD